jgi:hypothetical protein
VTDPSNAVDAYLASRYRTGLEQALLDATGGYATPAVAAVVDVISSRFDVRRHPDGGVSEGFTGTMTVQGVTYQFRCWVYIDVGGGRFLSDLSAFEPIGWEARIRLSGEVT